MTEINKIISDYIIDEFGRVVIHDPELIEKINGAGDEILDALSSNSGCGSNGACANAGCKRDKFMEKLDLDSIHYLTDEFGRIIIDNKEILEYINGAGGLELLTHFSNKGCGSNAACGNAGCDNLRC